jgi:hypothetical protein
MGALIVDGDNQRPVYKQVWVDQAYPPCDFGPFRGLTLLPSPPTIWNDDVSSGFSGLGVDP